MVKSNARDESADSNAVELLKSDHQEVAALLEEFESADSNERENLAGAICQKLTVHAQLEEEILYPAAREALEEDDAELVNEADVEHASVKELIAKIEGMSSSDELYQASLTVLGEYVKHHVEEEEKELFPLLQKTDLDLDEIGTRLASRKQELLEELGVDDDDGLSVESDVDEDASEEESEGETVVAKPASKSRSRNRK